MRLTSFSTSKSILATFLSLVVLAFSSLTTSTPTPPTLSYLFTVTAQVGEVLNPSIAILGGVRAVEPLTTGTITGPALNATVAGGVAYPALYCGVQAPEIVLYGTSVKGIKGTGEEGVNFLGRITGLGTPREQFADVTLEIGVSYAGLNQTFILADIRPNANRTIVVVDGYAVE